MGLIPNYTYIYAIFVTLVPTKNTTNPFELLHHSYYPLLIKS